MRAVLLVAVRVALAWPAQAKEKVLYCIETDSVGFTWQVKGTEWTEGQITNFRENRYVVRVLSEERRTVTRNTGYTAGTTVTLTCKKTFPTLAPDMLSCDQGRGATPWLFTKNKFSHAFLMGPPVGSLDPNIWISYGTCTGF